MTPPAPLLLPTADEALAWVRDRTSTGLAAARDAGGAGCASDPPAEPEGVLRRWDEVTLALSNVGAIAASLLPTCTPTSRCGPRARRPRSRSTSSSPSCARTAASTTCSPALDPAGLDPTAARLLDKTLEEFRRAGVDQDDATRARLAEISERITAIDQEFSRNIRDDVRTVQATARAARRPARGLAGRAPGRRRRSGHGDHRLPRLGAGADVRPGRRRPPRRSPSPSSSAAGPPTSRCSRSCSTCATSTPTWSATPTGRRTTRR